MLYRSVVTSLVALCYFYSRTSYGQSNNQRYAADNYRPVTPGVYSIAKYTENPTDLYHGIPRIGIPITTLKVGDKTFPLEFSYHAGGIRVTEEASWIGLGWDLALPTVTQAINDEDDLSATYQSTPTIVPRMRPDWPVPNTGYTIALPQRYVQIGLNPNDPRGSHAPGYGWTNPFPLNDNQQVYRPQPEPKHYYKSLLNYYVPVKNNFDTKQENLFTGIVDSEPDVFTVNLFGTQLLFIKDFETGYLTLLNNPLYTIQQTNEGWRLVDGDGFIYQFANKLQQITTVSDYNGYGAGGSSETPSTSVWYLATITSPQGHQASFTYEQPFARRATIDFKQKYQRAIRQNTYQTYLNIGEGYQSEPFINAGLYPDYIYPTSFITYETKNYITRITCDNATIAFYRGSRTDITNAALLDSVRILDSHGVDLLKSMVLRHDYFTANLNSNSSNTFSTRDPQQTEPQRNDLRLRLTSLEESTTGVYHFIYNAEPLPPRNSFAQDFWGYYNGAYTNTSLVPSAQRLNFHPNLIADNGTNMGARLPYAQAGILTRLTFPTGGSKEFEYELNSYLSLDEYGNYSRDAWLPDYDSLDNKLVKGNGLRIKRITSIAQAGQLPLVTSYTYAKGRPMLPTAYTRDIYYTYANVNGFDEGQGIPVSSYTFYEIKSAYQYSAAPIGSGTGVGYGRVEERQVSASNSAAAGYTVTYYANVADTDRLNDAGYYAAQAGGLAGATQISLPAFLNPRTKMNGLVDSVKTFDSSNNLRSKKVCDYKTTLSSIDYGVKFFNGGVYFEKTGTTSGTRVGLWTKYYIGFYPLFGKTSTLASEINTEYDLSNKSFRRKTTYEVDNLTRVTRKADDNFIPATVTKPAVLAPGITYSYLYPDYRYDPGDLVLMKQHRIAVPIKTTEDHVVYNTTSGPGLEIFAYSAEKFYIDNPQAKGVAVLGTILEKNSYPTETNAQKKITRYRLYDAWSRPKQLSAAYDAPVTYLWYDKSTLEIAEIKNGTPGTCLYTSFEDYEPGDWVRSMPAVSGGVTGRRCEPLDQGITTPSFSAGTYTFSYWMKGSGVAPTISSATGTLPLSVQLVATRTDGWTQYKGKLTTTQPATISFSAVANGYMDEFRLHTLAAQMSSYTYGPWQNITSQTDATGRIILYEYDAAGRLLRTRDEQGRILSQQQYHYVGAK